MFKHLFTFCFILFSSISAFGEVNSNPADTTVSLSDKAASILAIDQGKTLFNEGKTRDALNKFREAAVKDPTSWKAVLWVAQCHYVMNNFGLALKYANEAVELNKSDVDKEVYEILGRTYHRMEMLDSALISYKIANEMLPQYRSKELNIPLRIEQVMFAQSEIASGRKTQRVTLGSVNSGYNDYSPILTDGGNTLYFTSRRSDTKGGNMNPDDQEFFEDTYYAIWNAEENDWDSLSNELGRINSNGFDAINFITRDGTNGLMTINTTATTAKKTTKGSDLFTFEKNTKGKWSTPKRINNKTINTSFFEGSATMTNDGNTMYFVSDRKGDKSSTDIYFVQKIGKSWGEAKPLPFTINTLGRETTPFISGDGKFLFFSSDGHNGMGGLDVYVVENLGSTWGDPINLGIMVNTVNNDSHFQYYPEMKKAVMSGFEIIGQKSSMDIYQIDMTNYIYPKGN